MVENLIYKSLIDIPYIKKHGAVYNNNPAVFFQQFPHDKDGLWKNNMMFPRISYSADWSYNAERKADGNLTIEVYCLNESTVSPEDIAIQISGRLGDLFLTNDTGTYCLLWNRTDSFEVTGKEPLVIGVTISFDIIAFPKQSEITPSPIWAVNHFIKEMQPKCMVIGIDEIPPIHKVDEKAPVIYARLTETKNVKTSYAMAWQNASISIHVIAPPDSRNSWCDAILMDLSIEREALMQNKAPYLIMGIKHRMSANPIRTGQIELTGEYGILRNIKEGTKLNNIYIREE